MNTHILQVTQAMDFAANAHAHQRRKGSQSEPYVNHVTDVARILAEATGGEDIVLIIAALLHDTIEDQEVSHEQISGLFGIEVADLVQEVTDNMSIRKLERKLLQVANASRKSPRAKMLRIADKISNLNSILNDPPTHWDLNRKREYFEWAKQVVDGCRGVNAKLEALFDGTYQRRHELLESKTKNCTDHIIETRRAA